MHLTSCLPGAEALLFTAFHHATLSMSQKHIDGLAQIHFNYTSLYLCLSMKLQDLKPANLLARRLKIAAVQSLKLHPHQIAASTLHTSILFCA